MLNISSFNDNIVKNEPTNATGVTAPEHKFEEADLKIETTD